MASTTLGTLDELLEGALTEVDDSDTQYKLRNARQLVAVIEQRHHEVNQSIEEVVDDNVVETLRDLGYVD